MTNLADATARVVEEFRLEAIAPPVDLHALGKRWGVVSFKEEDISSHALLIKSKRGFTVILNRNLSQVRQRFSLAHEFGHILLYKAGLSEFSNGLDPDPTEEKICNEIAAEILMPKLAFQEDAWMEGWSLLSLRGLGRLYGASIEAAAKRMIHLMPEQAVMGVWKPPNRGYERPRLQWSDRGRTKYGVPSPSVVTPIDLQLIVRAFKSSSVLQGTAPLVPRQQGNPRPTNVPAEALSWGKGEHHQAMVFYYPERKT